MPEQKKELLLNPFFQRNPIALLVLEICSTLVMSVCLAQVQCVYLECSR